MAANVNLRHVSRLPRFRRPDWLFTRRHAIASLDWLGHAAAAIHLLLMLITDAAMMMLRRHGYLRHFIAIADATMLMLH